MVTGTKKENLSGLSLEELQQRLKKFQEAKAVLDKEVYELSIAPAVALTEKAIKKLQPKPAKAVQISFKQQHQPFLDSIAEQTTLVKQYVTLIQKKVEEYNKTQTEKITIVFDEVGDVRIKSHRKKNKTTGVATPTREGLVQVICREGVAKMDKDGNLIRGEDGTVERTGGEMAFEKMNKPSPGLTAKKIEEFWRKETKTPTTTSFSMNYAEFLKRLPGDGEARYVTFDHYKRFEETYNK